MDLGHKEYIALSLLKEHILSDKILAFEMSSDYSMRPFLLKGDEIVIKKVSVKDLSLGNIIVCQNKDYFYIHRFLYKFKINKKQKLDNSYLLITKGDNSISHDYPLPDDQLIGKAIIIQRKDRKIYLEGNPWRIINYVLGIISLFQIYTLKILHFFKNILFKNKTISFANPIKKILSFPLKSIVLALHLIFLKK